MNYVGIDDMECRWMEQHVYIGKLEVELGHISQCDRVTNRSKSNKLIVSRHSNQGGLTEVVPDY